MVSLDSSENRATYHELEDYEHCNDSENNVETVVDEDRISQDAFAPFRNMAFDGSNIITVRAILVGCLCGALVNASNIYLGLKTGWTASANLFGAIIGFSVLKKWSKRQPFGPHENNIVQTVATASGGMSNVFVSAVPALYQLGFLQTPVSDFFKIVTLTAASGYFGLFTITPLRKFFLIDVARELNLVFPSSSATAMTIRSMHLAARGEKAARYQTKVILISFLFALTLRVASQYALGLLWDWHIFVWLRITNMATTWALAAESWGWFLEWSPAMIGSGMLVGCNVAASFLLGSIVAWGVIGPYLVHTGRAFGTPVSDSLFWKGLVTYSSMSKDFVTTDHPSPRYWLLWPGVACMVFVAFVELACQWPAFWVFALKLYASVRAGLLKLFGEGAYKYARLNNPTDESKQGDADIAACIWVPGTIVMITIACVVMKTQFGMAVFETILALGLAFILSLAAIQATGATDTTPITALSKVSQVLLSTASDHGVTYSSAVQLNLLGGSMTNIGAGQATGFLLGTPPRYQFVAQLLGTFMATLVAPTVFILFTEAYPCILNPPTVSTNITGMNSCEFAGPTIAAWRAVAEAATEETLPVPTSSLRFAIVMSFTGAISILMRHFIFTGTWTWIRHYQINFMIFALAFTLPSAQYAITMMSGALAAKLWQSRNRKQYHHYGLAVAAGLVAGEGIGGTINALLSILGLGGEQLGLDLGCPAGKC